MPHTNSARVHYQAKYLGSMKEASVCAYRPKTLACCVTAIDQQHASALGVVIRTAADVQIPLLVSRGTCPLPTSFQGWMMAPKEAVSNAPAWKVMFLGLILMKAFAGATMFAATFVVSVAAVRPRQMSRHKGKSKQVAACFSW
eukprot:1158531-Pelagomonas_calceolata.AAC.2